MFFKAQCFNPSTVVLVFFLLHNFVLFLCIFTVLGFYLCLFAGFVMRTCAGKPASLEILIELN